MQMKAPRKPRTRLSDNEIRNTIEDYESSGNTIAQFCKQRGLNNSTFQRWKNKYATGAVPKKQVSFVPVKIKEKDNKQPIEPTLFAEVRGVRFYREVPVDYLLSIINS
jgi:transposase-like protein